MALPAYQNLDGFAEIGRSFNGATLRWIDVRGGWSVEVREEDWRFGSNMALPAYQNLDGVAEFRCRPFNGVMLIWIDVGGGWIDGRCCCLVSHRIGVTILSPSVAMCLDVFPVFLLCFHCCVFNYVLLLRLISHVWIIFSFHVVGIDQSVQVFAADGGPAVVVVMVCQCGYAGRRGDGSLHLSAICFVFYYFSLALVVSCMLFPGGAYTRGLRSMGFSPVGRTMCILSASERWRATIKWLLPPSVRMKGEIVKILHGFGGLYYKEVELLTSILCLCVGYFSLLSSCYLKTDRVASCALSVFRRKLEFVEYIYYCGIFSICFICIGV